MENQESQVVETTKTAPEFTGQTKYFAGETESTPVVDKTEEEHHPDSTTNDDSGQTDIDYDDDEKKSGKGFEKRIERFNRRLRERDDEIASLKRMVYSQTPTTQPQATNQVSSNKPTLAEYQNDVEKYTEALSDWKYEQRKADEQRQTYQKSYAQKLDDIKRNNPDFDDIVDDFSRKYAHVNADEINKYLSESDKGAELYYYLAQNHDETDRILSLPSIHRVAALGKLEAKLGDATASKTAKVSKAPRPVSPEKGGASPVSKDLNDPNLSQKEYRELRMQSRKRY